MQVDQAGQMWGQHQGQPTMQKMQAMQVPVKQPYYGMPPQDSLKLFEQHSVQTAGQMPMQPQQQNSMDKKMKYPDVKMQDFYWELPYRMGDNRQMVGERMGKRPPPGVFHPDQDNAPRGPPFEVSVVELLNHRYRTQDRLYTRLILSQPPRPSNVN